jgi:IS5 family transposase
MKPKRVESVVQEDLFRMRLENLIDPGHELVRLARLIDWSVFEREFGALHSEGAGQPPLPTRLMAGLTYLKHCFALSDEEVVARWCENPYWQHFCGEVFFRHDLPCHPTSLTRWRKRVGEAGCEWLLTETIDAGRRAGMLKRQSFEKVIVDTTVQEKAAAYPTDSRLLNTAREKLVQAAQNEGIVLRQSYARVGPLKQLQAGRYAHAKQYRRMRSAIRSLRTWLGRVIRDVERKATAPSPELAQILSRAKQLHAQKREDKHKLYAWHAPEVECIAKGKTRTPYEFGVKVSVAITAKEGFVVGARSMPGNPYDGHTLAEQLEQVEILTGYRPKQAFADRGYRAGTVPKGCTLYLSGQKRGVTAALKRWIKRRSAIEPHIGHMKSDGLLGRCHLKGALGDAMHAVLCGAGHNLRLLLNYLRDFLRLLIVWAVSKVQLPSGAIAGT